MSKVDAVLGDLLRMAPELKFAGTIGPPPISVTVGRKLDLPTCLARQVVVNHDRAAYLPQRQQAKAGRGRRRSIRRMSATSIDPIGEPMERAPQRLPFDPPAMAE